MVGQSLAPAVRTRSLEGTGVRIAITGGFGFLGWHTASRLRALNGVDAVRIGRQEYADPQLLAAALDGVDAVLHLAGVNRAGTDEEVEEGNVALARGLAGALAGQDRPIDVVYANSVQAELDNPYGRGKATAATVIRSAVQATGGHFADLLLPNLFGEHGRPGYNSFVATFAHEVAAGRRPSVSGDRQIPLLHAQDAAREILDSIGRSERRTVEGDPRSIGDVLALLETAHALYATRGEIPPLPGRFEVNLFNTYRAAAFPDMWPIAPQVHADDRGELFETVRAHGGTGQTFVSTTRPGRTRGDHYHLHKVERFFVVRGEAEIESAPPAARRRSDLSAQRRHAVVRRHAHAVGAQHPQRGRQRAGHDVLGRPAARPREPRPVPGKGGPP